MITSQSLRNRVDPFVLAALVLCSLFLTARVNRLAGWFLNATAPHLAWIATTAFPSCVAIACLYALLSSSAALRWPQLSEEDRRRAIRVSAMWLLLWIICSVIGAILAGHWIVYARGWPSIAAFLVFGPLGEELLFRGVIYEKARTIWRATPVPAICLSTAAFSLHHTQLQAAPHGLALAQVVFTIPMGIVFAILRERTRSIWPGFLVHVATNLPATF